MFKLQADPTHARKAANKPKLAGQCNLHFKIEQKYLKIATLKLDQKCTRQDCIKVG